METMALEEAEVLSFGNQIKIAGYADDGYYRHLADDLMPEIDLLTVTKLLVEEGDTVLDVGANIGFFSASVARMVGPAGKVYAYEPSPSNFELLQRNVFANGLTDVVEAVNYGLSDKKASHELHFNRGNRGGAFISDTIGSDFNFNETIHTKGLDKLKDKPKKVNFIKVDIEGHEPNFLRGAEAAIKKWKPACIMEANHWCLNALNNITMPDFLDQVCGLFPVVYAFDNDQMINVREQRMHFLYSNIVKNKLQNLYCDFSTHRAAEVLVRYQRFLNSKSALLETVTLLKAQNEELSREVYALRHSRSHLLATKVNTVLRRDK